MSKSNLEILMDALVSGKTAANWTYFSNRIFGV